MDPISTAAMQNGACYIVSVAGGLCVEDTSNPLGLLLEPAVGKLAQLWYIHCDGRRFAFQSAASKEKWIRAEGAGAGSRIILGDRQWWTLDKGEAPGSCSVKCDDFPDAYMNSNSAIRAPDTIVHVWPFQEVWIYTTTWYLRGKGDLTYLPSWSSSELASVNDLPPEPNNPIFKKA